MAVRAPKRLVERPPSLQLWDFAVAAGNDEDAPMATTASVRDLPLVPRLNPARLRLEIISRPQAGLPDPRAAGAFGKARYQAASSRNLFGSDTVGILQLRRGVAG
jgi:hypothetical protein